MRKQARKVAFRREIPLIVMLLPSVIILFIFSYIPLFGVVIAFQRYLPSLGVLGSRFVGFDNFRDLFMLPTFNQVLWNTVYIAFMKIVFMLVVPIIVALLLNEAKNQFVKRGVQTIIYMPFFMSWVILGGIFIDLLSPSTGAFNNFLGLFGIEPIFFLADNNWFPTVLISTHVWREFGFGTIVFLAALTSIDPSLYEAATVDGAARWKQTWHITLPGMMPIIVLMTVLSLGGILNAGFDQVFNLYSPVVYESGDILDTLIYRMGLINMRFGLATAAGLFRSVVSLVFIVTSYWLAAKYSNYRVL
ncbi:MAG: ABC transporter permease subunit [Defluviitaleaceae bacterium]|nr:ABC transporter permease subunit [Defluviitaleaceae bacterium]